MEQIVVTTLDDGDPSGETTLRQAIETANDSGLATRISFADALTDGIIRLSQGEIEVTGEIVIDAGDQNIVISGDRLGNDILDDDGFSDAVESFRDGKVGDNSRIFNHTGDGDLTLIGLGITGGFTFSNGDGGGGISSVGAGALEIRDSSIVGNGTNGSAASGGGVFVDGGDGLTVVGSDVSGNLTNQQFANGGGVSVIGADTLISHSSIVNNTVFGNFANGAGFSQDFRALDGPGDATILFTTIANNTIVGGSGDGGGVFLNAADARLEHVTITANASNDQGGGVFVRRGDVTVANSILTGNAEAQPFSFAQLRANAETPEQVSSLAEADEVTPSFTLPEQDSNGNLGTANGNDLDFFNQFSSNIELVNNILSVDAEEIFEQLQTINEGGSDEKTAGALTQDGRLFVAPVKGDPEIRVGSTTHLTQDAADADGDGDRGEIIGFDATGNPLVPVNSALTPGSFQPVVDLTKNDSPIANPITLTIREGQDVQIIDLLQNAFDPNGDAIVVASFNGLDVAAGLIGEQFSPLGAFIGPNSEGDDIDNENEVPNQIFYEVGSITDDIPDGETRTEIFGYSVVDIPEFAAPLTDFSFLQITINGVPGNGREVVAFNDNATVSEDDVSVEIDVLTNDFNPGPGNLQATSLEIVTDPELGPQATLSENGTLTFSAAGAFDDLAQGETKEITLQYTAINPNLFGDDRQDTGEVTITITGVDDPTVTSDREVTVSAGETAQTSVGENVSDEDTDFEADSVNGVPFDENNSVTIEGVGTVTRDDNGNIIFTHDDSFDDQAIGDVRTVTLTIGVVGTENEEVTAEFDFSVTVEGTNRAPIAVDDSFGNFSFDTGTNEILDGLDILSGIAGILQNDSDPDGDAIILQSIDGVLALPGASLPLSSGAEITLGVTPFGPSILFDPNGAYDDLEVGEQLLEFFNYTIADEHGATSTATISFGLFGISSAQLTAVDNIFAVNAEGEIASGNVISDDLIEDGPGRLVGFSQDGAALGVGSDQATSLGGITFLNNAGQFTYLPNGAFTALGAGERATETFTYDVQDQGGLADQGNIRVTVIGLNDAPEANNIGSSARSGRQTVISTDVSDPDANDTLSITIGTGPANGDASVNPDGTVTYTSNDGFVGKDLFTYTVTDQSNETATATISVNVFDGLLGTDGDDFLSLGAGDTGVSPLLGTDRVILDPAAAAKINGNAAELDRTIVENFNDNHAISVLGSSFSREHVEVTQGSAILDIDTNQDGSADARVTLLGDFLDGGFMVARGKDGTLITFEDFLPELTEGQAVSPAAINGIVNPGFLQGHNASGMSVTLEANAQSEFDNTIGFYEIEAAGDLVNVQILAENAKTATAQVDITVSDQANGIGFFLVQDGARTITQTAFDADAFTFVSDGFGGFDLASQGNVLSGVTTFLSHDGTLNPDGQTHVLSGVSGDDQGALRIGFEDLLRDGTSDDDFQDVVLLVDVGSANGNLII